MCKRQSYEWGAASSCRRSLVEQGPVVVLVSAVGVRMCVFARVCVLIYVCAGVMVCESGVSVCACVCDWWAFF